MSQQSGGEGGSLFDVPYGPDPHQTLDIYLPDYLPDHPARAPLVLCIHGGGWSVGDKAQYAAVGARLAREGLVAAVANYRLSPAVQHPAHVEDIARAVAWCYHHAARYGGDPERLCLLSHSAGAHLAALVALDPTYLLAQGLATSTIRRVVGIAGVGYDLDESYAASPAAPFFCPVFGPDSSRWAEAAPLRYVTPAAPPFLLVHGLSDTEAPPSSTEVFAATLRRMGVPVQLALLPGEGHISVMFAAAPLALAFLQTGWPDPSPAMDSPAVRPLQMTDQPADDG